MLDDSVKKLLDTPGLVLWLTGAGISAESGIPTFRGREGYWQVGSRNYQPEEMATLAAFRQMPEEVWAWYLYRRGICRGAEPNVAHRALAAAERHGRSIAAEKHREALHESGGGLADRPAEFFTPGVRVAVVEEVEHLIR